MALSASIATAAPEQHELSIAVVPGLIGLGVATAVDSLMPIVATHNAARLAPVLLLCALLQIGVGLYEWRRGRPFFSTLFTAFGLFACSRIPQLYAARTALDSQDLAGSVLFLLLWGTFALLLAGNVPQGDRLLRTLLGAVAVTLFSKALILSCGLTGAWPVVAGVGLLAAGMACGIGYRTMKASARG